MQSSNKKETKVGILEREEGQIVYEDTGGTGPLVVCVPGMGVSRSVYRFSTPLLAIRGYRVVTMDLRGMGDSSVGWRDYSESAIASDILALIQRLNSGPAILIGNSIGAGAAVCVAADYPQLVARLVLAGPFVRQIPVSRLKLVLFRLVLMWPWGVNTWVNYQANKLYPSAKPDDMDSFNRALRAKLHERGRLKALQRMAATDHRAAEARLDNVHVPSLIIMGGADPDFPDPRSEAELVANRIQGKSVILEGVGHYPQAEVPNTFVDQTLEFLKSEIHA